MNHSIEQIEVKNAKDLGKIIKNYLSMVQSNYYQAILEVEVPKEEDFLTKEEYEDQLESYQIELINDVELIKKDIFQNVLKFYNNFLTEKRKIEKAFTVQKELSEATILHLNSDIKIAGVVTIALSLAFPTFAPIIIWVNLPRVGIDFAIKKKQVKKIEKNQETLKEVKEIQDELYEIVSDIRMDYHKSNQECKELKNRAKKKEIIIGDLIETLHPERIHLQLFEKESFQQEELQKIKSRK